MDSDESTEQDQEEGTGSGYGEDQGATYDEGSGSEGGDTGGGYGDGTEGADESGGDLQTGSGQTWTANCESGHFFWAGPERSSYDAAQADATAHDNSRHGGVQTAVVL